MPYLDGTTPLNEILWMHGDHIAYDDILALEKSGDVCLFVRSWIDYSITLVISNVELVNYMQI